MHYINRAKQLASDLRAMDVQVTDQELAMTNLTGLPSLFEHLIVAIDALGEDEMLKLDFVNRCILQVEQRMEGRTSFAPRLTDTALVGQPMGYKGGQQVPTWSHFKKRQHTDPKCWQKYPHLRPEQKRLVINVS